MSKPTFSIVPTKSLERVDLVDATGKIKKCNVLRAQAHAYPQLHLQIVIGIIFDDQGNILIHQRAKTKSINPGDIDHVCGAVESGETPYDAFIREAKEETGVKLNEIRLITQDLNHYNRYRYLFVGKTSDQPTQPNPTEVDWVRFMSLEELKLKHQTGELTYVNEFFEDTELVLQNM